MFTGLIEEIGAIKSVKQAGEGKILAVSSALAGADAAIGDSISISGACQTVTARGTGWFEVFASGVTCELTTLGGMKPGDRVNLERAMSASSRFGGHIVQGHVDGTGIIGSLGRDAYGLSVSISAPKNLMKYIVTKGSVAVDGISLTVVEAQGGSFSLYIIPETVKSTTVDSWKRDTRVNIETDILAKYVEKMLAYRDNTDRSDDAGLMKKLAEEGFV